MAFSLFPKRKKVEDTIQEEYLPTPEPFIPEEPKKKELYIEIEKYTQTVDKFDTTKIKIEELWTRLKELQIKREKEGEEIVVIMDELENINQSINQVTDSLFKNDI